MKTQSKQIAILVVLAIAAFAIWNRNRPQTDSPRSTVASLSSFASDENLGIQWSKIEASRESKYMGERNIFSDNIPSSQVRRHSAQRMQPIAPDQATAPELPMKFFGYGNVPNGTPRRAYLTDGDEVYIVSEGDILLGHYRILKIRNAALDFEEISSQQRGEKALEQIATGS